MVSAVLLAGFSALVTLMAREFKSYLDWRSKHPLPTPKFLIKHASKRSAKLTRLAIVSRYKQLKDKSKH